MISFANEFHSIFAHIRRFVIFVFSIRLRQTTYFQFLLLPFEILLLFVVTKTAERGEKKMYTFRERLSVGRQKQRRKIPIKNYYVLLFVTFNPLHPSVPTET